MSDNSPPHYLEHEQLIQLVAKIVDKSELINFIILITVGVDGRPCIGTDLPGPGMTSMILRQLGEAEEHIGNVAAVVIPKDN